MSATNFSTSKLITAIRQSSLIGVIDALDDGANIEEADIYGLAGLPLRTACFGGNTVIIRELIRRGADLNAAGSDGPGMPLRLALRAKHLEIARLLIDNGAHIPPGLTLPPELLAGNASLAIQLPEALTPPLLPETVEFGTTPAETLNEPNILPDWTTDTGSIIEEVDIEASYGVDTNLLTMDMLRFNEDADDQAPTPSRERHQETPVSNSKGGFWKTGRHT